MSHNPYEIRVFEPDEISFSRGAGGVLQGVIGGSAYDELAIHRVFPFQYASEYISIRNVKGDELGIILSIDALDAESAEELRRELQYRYFLPMVTRVDRVREQNEMWVWELQTNLGPTRMMMRNLHEHMIYPGANRIILTDMSGKRCEIADWQALDRHSRNQLKDVI